MLEKLKNFFRLGSSQNANWETNKVQRETDFIRTQQEKAYNESLRKEMDLSLQAMNQLREQRLEAIRTGNQQKMQELNQQLDAWKALHYQANIEQNVRKTLNQDQQMER